MGARRFWHCIIERFTNTRAKEHTRVRRNLHRALRCEPLEARKLLSLIWDPGQTGGLNPGGPGIWQCRWARTAVRGSGCPVLGG
jgi:hypothetical protein